MSTNDVNCFFDIDILRQSSFDEEKYMKEFLELLLAAIDDADVKIKEAIKRTSRKDLMIKIHSIKSNFRICGFIALFEKSKSMEMALNNHSTIEVAEINKYLEEIQEARTICVTELSKLS